MAHNKKVSVIIPFYNSSKTIIETINSVLNSSYENIEIILVDDQSTDDTPSIIKKTFPNLSIITNKSKGANSARNLGFKHSSGDYIQYLDADDIISSNKISNQIKLIHENNKLALISCKRAIFKENVTDFKLINQKIDKDYKIPKRWLIDSWLGNGYYVTGNWLFSRKLHLLAGDWDINLYKNQDGDFFSRIINCASEIIFDNSSILFYRVGNPNSISSNTSNAYFWSAYQVVKNYEQLYISKTEEICLGLANCYANLISNYIKLSQNQLLLLLKDIEKLNVDYKSISELNPTLIFRFKSKASIIILYNLRKIISYVYIR